MESPGERIPMKPTGDRPAAGCGSTHSDPDYMVVRTHEDVLRLSADILGQREKPIVGLTHGEDRREPVLAAGDVRALVGVGVRIYLVADGEVLEHLRDEVGPRLALERAAVRVWWPGASVRCDPCDHPLVLALEDERPTDILQELSHQLDLSRPCVRAQFAQLEDARAFVEHELKRAEQRIHEIHERLRDSQIECHRQRTRAEAAEARLAALESQPGSD
jgi:hypothetical protein